MERLRIAFCVVRVMRLMYFNFLVWHLGFTLGRLADNFAVTDLCRLLFVPNLLAYYIT